MNLYIEIENGAPKNHPAFEDNLIQAFGFIPEHWEPFVRVERPKTEVYKKIDPDEPSYEKVNGVWTDVWTIRDMTAEEKAATQKFVRDAFNDREYSENWSAWIFDEENCRMIPPIPRPEPDQTKLDAGIMTAWCGADNNWRDMPIKPSDNNQYKFDFLAWQWVAIA